jgi:hypothetical protein
MSWFEQGIVQHGTWCAELGCGWFVKVPRLHTGMVDGLERCLEYGTICG